MESTISDPMPGMLNRRSTTAAPASALMKPCPTTVMTVSSALRKVCFVTIFHSRTPLERAILM